MDEYVLNHSQKEPQILQELNPRHFPLMFSMLNTICKNKKLEIDW